MNEKLVKAFKKCKEDPEYFLTNYIKVIHPVRGLVPFDLYPFQKKIVGDLQNYRFNILRKFRQAGCTTIASSWALWFVLFQKHKTVVILSKGDAESTEVLDRIKMMYEELPDYLKPGIAEDNKHTMKLKNGSVIKSRASGKQSGRSLAGSVLIIDEAAFIDNIDTIWAAVYPIISTGGKAFVLSTVNGVGNWYHETYLAAVAKESSFNAMDIEWKEHPEYFRNPGYEHLYEEMEARGVNVDDWEKTTRSNMPVKQWLQEYESNFLGTGETFMDGTILTRLMEGVDDEFWINYNNKMRVWEEPQPQYEYIIGVDIAMGRDRDYSAFQVLNTYTGNQVAEFYSNKTPINEFAKIIDAVGNKYNTALVCPERNTIGNNLIDWLFNVFEYDNLWMDDKGDFGLQVTQRNRDEILNRMEEFVRNNKVKINSRRTMDELLTFIITESGRIEADKGKHDDLIMSLAVAVNLLHTLGEFGELDLAQNPHKEFKPLEPSRTTITDSYGQVTEEDIKWLME
tara:strand:+ start:1781 stop:3313 length:1533 start_codon:yes stop_codon:yes gene_type:complete